MQIMWFNGHRLRGRLGAIAAAGLCLGLMPADASAVTKILNLGDSLVYGQGFAGGGSGFSSNDLGYRLKLQQLMFDDHFDYDMIGGFTAGSASPFDPTPIDPTTYTGPFGTLVDSNDASRTRALDLDHFGLPGAEAGPDFGPGVTLQDRNLSLSFSYDSTDETVEFSNGNGSPYVSPIQDVNPYGGLIQQGAGDIFEGPNPGQPFDQAALTASTNPNKSSDWLPSVPDVVLLHIGTNTISTGANSDVDATSHLTDLLDELYIDWQSGQIANDAKIFVADIVPKAYASSSDGINSLDTRLLDNTFEYNQSIDSVIASLDPAFQSLFERVDMFDIQITQDMLDVLGLGDASSLNLDNDGQLDWLTGSYDETLNSGTADEANTNLFGNADFIHLAPLGYEVMAYQWYNALLTTGVIPEPATVVLMAAGGVLVLSRRRRLA